MAHLAEAHEIYNAALEFRKADLEYQQADQLDDAGYWREEAQQQYNAARDRLMALCDTRLRSYEATH